MAIATCPKCVTKLKVPDGTTASVRCPKCQTVFKSTAPAAAAPPPAPPPPPPPAKAESAFANLDDDDDRPRKKRPRDDDDDDDRPRKKRSKEEDEDDRPRSKKKSRDDDEDDDRPRKKRRDDDDDDDDRPRSKKRTRDDDDDEDDRPRKKKRRDEDDDDDDDRPRKPASKFGLARTGVLLLLISLGLYGAGMALQCLFITIAFIGGVIPAGMSVLTGILGLANWLTGLVGLGLCIAGPSRARGLAIAAVSVAAVHLVLTFVTANDSDSMPSNLSIPVLSGINRLSNVAALQRELAKNPSKARADEIRDQLKSMSDDKDDDLGDMVRGRSRGGMRWADLTTYLTYSDKLIAILAYESKGFSKALLGIFSGLTELARLILISLLLGSLAGVAKDYRGQSRAKLGWILSASLGGGALLVMLLAFVIADSVKPDAKDLQPQLPAQPQFDGRNFEEFRKQQDEYNRQSQAAFEKAREKAESAGKAPLRWFGVGELLCLMMHVASVAMPAMAALGLYSATGGGGRTRYKKRSRRDDEDEDD